MRARCQQISRRPDESNDKATASATVDSGCGRRSAAATSAAAAAGCGKKRRRTNIDLLIGGSSEYMHEISRDCAYLYGASRAIELEISGRKKTAVPIPSFSECLMVGLVHYRFLG